MAVLDDDTEDLEEIPMPDDENNREDISREETSPRKTYSPDELLSLRSLPLCNIKPSVLNEQFFDSSGRWNPVLWHSSLFNVSLKGGSRKANTSRKYNFNNYSGPNFVPQRQSFGLGCKTRMNHSQATFDSKRDHKCKYKPQSSIECSEVPEHKSAAGECPFFNDPSSEKSRQVTFSTSAPVATSVASTASDKNTVSVKFEESSREQMGDLSSKANLVEENTQTNMADLSVELKSDCEPEWLSVSVEMNGAEFDFGNLEDLKKQFNNEANKNISNGEDKKRCDQSTSLKVQQLFATKPNGNALKVMTLQDVEEVPDESTSTGRLRQVNERTENKNDELKAFNDLLHQMNSSLSNSSSSSARPSTNVVSNDVRPSPCYNDSMRQSRLVHLFPQQRQPPARKLNTNLELPDFWNSDKIKYFGKPPESITQQSMVYRQGMNNSLLAENHLGLSQNSNGALESFLARSINSDQIPTVSNCESSASWGNMAAFIQRNGVLNNASSISQSSGVSSAQSANAMLYADYIRREHLRLNLAQEQLLKNAALLAANGSRMPPPFEPRGSHAATSVAHSLNSNFEARLLQEQLRNRVSLQNLIGSSDRIPSNAPFHGARGNQILNQMHVQHPGSLGNPNLDVLSGRPNVNVGLTSRSNPAPPAGLTPSLQLMFQRRLAEAQAMQYVQN